MLPFKPIPDYQAVRRLTGAGLDLETAQNLSDRALLSFGTIGRRTLAWVRSQPTNDRATTERLFAEAHRAMVALGKQLNRHPENDGTPSTEALGELLALAFDAGCEVVEKTPHHREADALYQFADNVRWEDEDTEEDD